MSINGVGAAGYPLDSGNRHMRILQKGSSKINREGLTG